MKKSITWICIGIILLIVLIVSYLTFRPDSMRFKNSYEWYNFLISKEKNMRVSIPSNNKVKCTDAKEFLKLMEEETGIFYLGYPTCPWCRNIVSPLIEVSNKNNMPVYYLDIKQKSVDQSFKDEFMKKYGSFLNPDSDGNKKIYVPDVYFIKNGEVIGHHLGSVDSQKDPYKILNLKQKEELMKIYQDFIDQMVK